MSPKITSLYPTNPGDRRTAFYTSFGIQKESVAYEFRVERDRDGIRRGCNVSSVTLCCHCSGPHLEVVSHILESAYPATVSDALEPGKFEKAILITPRIEMFAESKDTYPVGSPHDKVISREALLASLADTQSDEDESVIIRIPEDEFSVEGHSGEIRDWPYLTLEAATFLHTRFKHLRTNAPSIEKQYSQGGMWSHAIFFGIDPERYRVDASALEKRTVGELFHLPRELTDGRYKLICPFYEVGLDCALTLPLLIS